MCNNFLFIFCLLLATSSLSAQRTKYNFNSSWKVDVGEHANAKLVEYDDSRWKAVTLPYAWNEDEAFKKDIADLSTGIAWYRKHFTLPAGSGDRKVFIEFEGVRQAAEIYVNGSFAGLHENGVMAFGFDISLLVKFNQDNVIAVRTDNSWEYREKSSNTKFQWIDKNFNANYGGIPKNVYLHITPRLYQTLPLYSSLGTVGAYIYAREFNIAQRTALINATSEIRNEDKVPRTFIYQVNIREKNGKILKSFQSKPATVAANAMMQISASARVTGLNFWSWGYGYLYDVETCLLADGKIVDRVFTTTGFRKTSFDDGLIRLNDRVIQIHGYAQRTSNEWPAIGMSVPAWLSDYSNRLMTESNGNLVRWMHITPWKQDVESCDRMGLMQAMPAGDAEKDVADVRWEQRKNVMRDAIVYNRNNPSIIFYECGNENISEDHMKQMKAIRDEYDPFGGRAIGSREMLDSKTAEYGGEMLYVNKSAHIPVWAMEYSRDEGLRKYWDEFSPPYHKDGDGPPYRGQDASAYNRNQDSHAMENVTRWYDFWKERPGTGKRVSSGGVNIIFSETNTHHRGAENYRRSGEVDALRIRKENFYAHQVMWNGWVDVEKQGIHIIGHWNYTDSTVKDITVISSASKVELSVNGLSLGFGKQKDRFLFTFPKVKWKAGTLSATGYAGSGNKICSTSIKTTGEPVALRLTSRTNPNGMRADGHDVALVEVEVIDAHGQRCPVAMDMIQFTLEGNGEWRGGMAQGPDNFILSKLLPVECGVNRVLIRSTTKAGVITVTARAQGLRPAQLKLKTTAFPAINGLSTVLPATGLPVNLEKGPTPSTPSFTPTRTSRPIIKALAGANPDSFLYSIDDNELSDWHNDGQLSTAWIEYELETHALVSEVNMKLNNFRSRTYPLRITVDGEEVFNGNSVPGLGYFLAECKPRKGKRIRIQLVNPPGGSGQDKMTEVTGKKLDDGVGRDDINARGTLSLIEVEIYGPAAPSRD